MSSLFLNISNDITSERNFRGIYFLHLRSKFQKKQINRAIILFCNIRKCHAKKNLHGPNFSCIPFKGYSLTFFFLIFGKLHVDIYFCDTIFGIFELTETVLHYITWVFIVTVKVLKIYWFKVEKNLKIVPIVINVNFLPMTIRSWNLKWNNKG